MTAKLPAVLLVGNGLSIDLVSYLGLESELPMQCHRIVPCPDSFLYLPTTDDDTPIQRLNDRRLFPHMPYAAGDTTTRRPTHTCPITGLIDKFPDRLDERVGAWIWTDERFQFRCYLWHWLHYLHSRVAPAIASDTLNLWRWAGILRYLSATTSLTIISYNYDCHLELALHQLGIEAQSGCYWDKWQPTPGGAARVLKPHGCYTHVCNISPGPRPWARQQFWFDNEFDLKYWYHWQYPVTNHPGIPDLVIPGESHSTHPAPAEENFAHARIALSEARCVLVAGLSGAPPDDVEFTSLFAGIRRDTQLVQVDLCENRMTEVLLATPPRRVHFLTAPNVDVASLIPLVEASPS